MKAAYLTVVFSVIILMLLVGCSPKQTPPESPLTSPLSSPLPASTTQAGQVTPFRLDKPIYAGATRVSGQGPAGVPVMLQDITFGGPLLALSKIDQDGYFEFELDKPLEGRHRIGLALGNLEGTGLDPQNFTSQFYGDESMNIPQVGFFFDTALVQE